MLGFCYVQNYVACGLVRVRHNLFPGQSECFVAVLLTYLIHIDGASYLKGYCSLMFFIHVLMFL